MPIVTRWGARVASLAGLGLLALFLVHEGFDPSALTPGEWLLFAFFPVGVSAGMVIGWRREALGGTVVLVSLLMFYASDALISGDLPRGWAFPMFGIPGALFLISASVTSHFRRTVA